MWRSAFGFVLWLATGAAFAQVDIEAAKKEGEVMVYHSTQTEDLKPVFDAFTKKYGIVVKDWRSSSENVVKRIIGETRAGKLTVDLIENNSPEQEALRRENMLRRMQSPHFADLAVRANHRFQKYIPADLSLARRIAVLSGRRINGLAHDNVRTGGIDRF